MTFEAMTFNQIQKALGFSNPEMAAALGMSQRMVGYMKSGEYPITTDTAKRLKQVIKDKISELQVLNRCIK